MLTQSSFLRLRPLSTHGLASKRPAAKFLGLILFEPKKSVKKFKVRTSLPTQCPHTSTVTFGPGVLSNKITSSCAWLSGARYCPRHGKPAVLGLHRCVRGFPRSFSQSRDRMIFFDAIKCSDTNVHLLDGTPFKIENGRTLVALRGASDKFTHQFQRRTYWTDSATVIPIIRLCAPAYFDFEAREIRRNPWQFWFLLGQFPTAQARR